MTILKFQERFKREKILKTSRIEFYRNDWIRRLLARIVIDWASYIFTGLILFFSFFNSTFLLFLIVMIPIILFFLYHQIYFVNKVFISESFLSKKYTSDRLKLAFRAKDCFDQPYLVYRKDKVNIDKSESNRLLNLAFVSDIHFGNSYTSSNFRKLERIANLINSLPTDIFIFGGDLLNDTITEKAFLLFNLIDKKYKLGVWGNHDSCYLKKQQQFEDPQEFIQKCKEYGLIILNNQSMIVEGASGPVLIGGIGDMFSLSFNLDETFENVININSYPEIKVDELPRILISHNPDIIDYTMPEDNIDFVLSGHNHNGQVNLFDRIHLPITNKYSSLLQGHYITDKNTHLFLSSGAGSSGVRTRVGSVNTVEALQVELTNKP